MGHVEHRSRAFVSLVSFTLYTALCHPITPWLVLYSLVCHIEPLSSNSKKIDSDSDSSGLGPSAHRVLNWARSVVDVSR